MTRPGAPGDCLECGCPLEYVGTLGIKEHFKCRCTLRPDEKGKRCEWNCYVPTKEADPRRVELHFELDRIRGCY